MVGRLGGVAMCRKSFGLFALGGVALLAVPAAARHQDAQQIDPAGAAASIAKSLQPVPRDMGNGARVVDARAEGPLLVIAIELPIAGEVGALTGGFVLGMCGGEFRGAMDRLFSAGLKVRADLVFQGKRTSGTIVSACPAAAGS